MTKAMLKMLLVLVDSCNALPVIRVAKWGAGQLVLYFSRTVVDSY